MEINYIQKFNEEKYLNNKEVSYRVPNSELTSIWNELLEDRNNKKVILPLKDKRGNNFSFVLRENTKLKLREPILDFHFNANYAEASLSAYIEGYIDENTLPITNILKAVNYFVELQRNIKVSDLVHMGDLVNKDILLTEGIRKSPVYVCDDEMRIKFNAPKEELIEDMLVDLVNFINKDDNSLNPLVKAAIIHFVFVYIHPFNDGNGRTARALAYAYLKSQGIINPISPRIYTRRKEYYESINKCEDVHADLTYFIDFIIDCTSTLE